MHVPVYASQLGRRELDLLVGAAIEGFRADQVVLTAVRNDIHVEGSSLEELLTGLQSVREPGDPDSLSLVARREGCRVVVEIRPAEALVTVTAQDGRWAEGTGMELRRLLLDAGGTLRRQRLGRRGYTGAGIASALAAGAVAFGTGLVPTTAASLALGMVATVLCGIGASLVGRGREHRQRTRISLTGPVRSHTGWVVLSNAAGIGLATLVFTILGVMIMIVGVAMAHRDAAHSPAPSAPVSTAPRR